MTTTDRPLAQWLRLLWGTAPALHLDSAAPFIASGGIHLPAQPHWQQHCAAAAHAAAHLVYSPAGFDGTALVPVARGLLALLEDARVEALAMRELPGLARLWRPLHTATPDDGNACEPLMQRLARALADPFYDDPHPWVAKGRRLFYLDEGLALLALRTPAELRDAALRLGHDIGQMRLPFNAKGYRPAPAYRDDHRWMWAADQLALVQPPPQPQPVAASAEAQARPEPDVPTPDEAGTVTRHPEWDRLIHRLRPDWARVIEPTLLPAATAAAVPAIDLRTLGLSRRLLAPLRALCRQSGARRRSPQADHFDLDALVAWRVAPPPQRSGDARVYWAPQRQACRTAVWLLIDQSASTADRLGPAGRSALQVAALAAAATARALQAMGVVCAVVAFSSNGRQAVRLRWLKGLADPVDAGLDARLQTLRSGGSTRLGAALRHATLRLGAVRADARWVLLLSDGQPHDVDVHDARYLVDDARQAVAEAARRAVRIACLRLAPAASTGGGVARRIFGARGVQPLDNLDALPQAVARLLA